MKSFPFFRVLLLSVLLTTFTFSSLQAGGGGGKPSVEIETRGYLQGGDAVICRRDGLLLTVVTDVPNPTIKEWLVKYPGAYDFVILQEQGIGNVTSQSLGVTPENGTQYYVIYVSGDKKYATDVATITVKENRSTAGVISGDQAVVSTSVPAQLNDVTEGTLPYGGQVQYTWLKSIDQSNWVHIPGANSKNYQPSPQNQKTYYRRGAHNSDGYCVSLSNVVAIDVLIAPISGMNKGQFCAYGRADRLFVTPSTIRQPAIQWEKSTNQGTTWTQIPGATGKDYTPVETVAGEYRYRAKVSWESGTQSLNTDFREVTYYPILTSGPIRPEDQTVTQEELPQELIGTMPSGGNGTYTYQWQILRSADNWEDLTSGTYPTKNANYQVEVNGAGNYRRVVADGIGCVAVSNVAKVTVENLNPGTVGHNATIGRHGRHRPLVSTSPTNGTAFQWQRRRGDDGINYENWNIVQDWSAEQDYRPQETLDLNYVQYRRIARVVVGGTELASNLVTIRVSETDPGGIDIDPARVRLTQYDILGKISSDPLYPTTYGAQKRFMWQKDNPDIDGLLYGRWTNLMSAWGDSLSSSDYQYNEPLVDVGVHAFRRLFVQDVNNIGDQSKIFESNEVTVYVEALQGGRITISDTIVPRDGLPGAFTNQTNGNGKFYKWQWRNSNADGTPWIDLTPWVENGLEYTTTETMTIPLKQYRRICKTLITTGDDKAQSSNVITVHARAIEPGVVSVDPLQVVLGGRVNLSSSAQGSGSVFKWQVRRQQEDGSWGAWETLGSDVFSADKAGAQDVSVRHSSQYRRLSKSSVGESDLWTGYSNEVSVEVIPLVGGRIAGNQDIVKNGLPSRFTNVESGNGEVYAWYRKREGETSFTAITDWGNNLEYSEETPVEIISYYRRLVKPLPDSPITDTVGSNTVIVNPQYDLQPGSIAISSTGSLDTTVNVGFLLASFHSKNNGNGAAFKWQRQSEGAGDTWTDITEWGRHLTYQDPSPTTVNVLYRRCAKAAISNPDNLMSFSDTIKINVSRLDGGEIARDTIVNIGDIPNKFRNIRSGEGSVYKWQKKIGSASWIDIDNWSSSNLEYQESNGISATTYYRRLNKQNIGTSDNQSVSSNIIRVSIEELSTRDETVNADNFYLTVNEVSLGLTDDMLISRAQARAIDNTVGTPVEIKQPVIHNIQGVEGTYRATFSTAKGESKTVKVYVVESSPLDGIALFAQPFTLYTSELEETITDALILSRSEARGYDLSNQKPIPLSVRDRVLLNEALASIPVTLGTYPVILGYLGVTISVDVTIGEGEMFNVDFDINFGDPNEDNLLEPLTVTSGQRYGNLSTPIRTGSEFLYWSLDLDGLSPVDSTTIVGSLPGTDVEHTLYAIWKYPVTLDLNGGEGDSVIFVQQYRPYQYFQQFPVPQRKGYLFVGWSFDPDGMVMVDGALMVEERNEHTLYAIWEAREITVIFDASGGIVSPDRTTFLYHSNYNNLPTPKYSYYTFIGWYMADGKTQVSQGDKVDTVAVEIVLYARYTTYTKSDNDRYVITANGDGLNDRLYLQFLWYGKEEKVEEVQVYIYDRRGTLVYSKNNYQLVDGEFDGANLSDGTYIVSVHYIENGKKEVYNATITILR